VRAQAARLAEIAARDHATHLGYLAEVLAAELDDRSARRAAMAVPYSQPSGCSSAAPALSPYQRRSSRCRIAVPRQSANCRR
ncbi:MAG: hypothetical protein WBE65_10050, partial [Steroidobacteraceae bacterium]